MYLWLTKDICVLIVIYEWGNPDDALGSRTLFEKTSVVIHQQGDLVFEFLLVTTRNILAVISRNY